MLDVACGTGNFTRRFARAVGDAGLAVGTDLSETMLTRAVADTDAAGLAGHTAYIRCDAERLPFADHSRIWETAEEHRAIAAAISAGDAEGARAAMQRHLLQTAARAGIEFLQP